MEGGIVNLATGKKKGICFQRRERQSILWGQQTWGEEEFVQQESGCHGGPWEKRAGMWGFLEISDPFNSFSPSVCYLHWSKCGLFRMYKKS